MRSKVVSFEEAIQRVPDGATVSVCGAWMLVPDKTLAALERRFLNEGHPRNLTAVFAICPGGVEDQPGIDRLAHEGLLRRVIGGSFPNAASPIRQLITDNKVEAYNLPSGLIASWYREIAAGRPGVFTQRGLGTFVDPRSTGGKMNSRTQEDLLSVEYVRGQEYLFLPSMRMDVALIRGTTADEAGNITMEQEPATLTAFVQAAAARASGGLVIAQVKRVARTGTLHPQMVKVPGTLVDCVVVDPDQIQASGVPYEPALSGEIVRPYPSEPVGSPMDRYVAERAAKEVRDGDVVVLGYGISAYVPYVLLRQGRFHEVKFAIEQGSIGGLPLVEFGFGNSLNPQAIVDAATQFELFQGGCFDLAMLSFLQVDAEGRVNVHLLKARPHLSVGIGGFIDIATSARRIVFVGYFTAGGQQLALEDGRLRILREGKSKKFVRQLDAVSFDPSYGRAEEILFVTERATLRWSRDGFVVTEVAPGADLEKDVLGQMEFVPKTLEVIR